jgi:hypothetical protein
MEFAREVGVTQEGVGVTQEGMGSPLIALAPSSSRNANKETRRRERALERRFNIGHPEADELSSIVLTIYGLHISACLVA